MRTGISATGLREYYNKQRAIRIIHMKESGFEASMANVVTNEAGKQEREDVQTAVRESEEDKLLRLNRYWDVYTQEVSQDPELLTLVQRGLNPEIEHTPEEILDRHAYPPRSEVSSLAFDRWRAEIDQRFVKDGQVYVLRGDYPGRRSTGFYAYTYAYLKLNVEQLQEVLRSPDDVNPLVYGKEWTSQPVVAQTVAEQLAYQQSAIGRSSYISTTTNIPCARAGTGNQMTEEERATYQIYVIRVPAGAIIKRPEWLGHFGLNEEEYLVPDRIMPDEIVGVYGASDVEGVFEFLHSELGVSREDVGLSAL